MRARDEFARLQWKATRNKWEDQFEQQLRFYNVEGWKRQFQFDPQRRWHTDFAFPNHWILIEIEGGIWRKGGGAHSHPLNIIRDIEKYTRAAEMGYRLFRFIGEDLKKLNAVEMIARIVGTRSDRLLTL